MKTNRLGRGIGALIEDKLNDQSSQNIIKNIMIVDIKMNPFQPRIEFDDNKINKLAKNFNNLTKCVNILTHLLRKCQIFEINF